METDGQLVEMEDSNMDQNYIVQYAHQKESVHELHHMQNEINSVLSISDLFEMKSYFLQVGFQ